MTSCVSFAAAIHLALRDGKRETSGASGARCGIYPSV
jgi:hypothetical protein